MANPLRSKKILILCSSNEEHVHCAHAVVEMNTEYAAKILSRHEMFKYVHDTDTNLMNMAFWDAPVEFFENLDPEEWLDAEALAKLEVDEWLILPVGVEPPDNEPIRTEMDRLVVDDRHFYFRALDKYCDATFETRPMLFAALAAIAP